MTYTPGQVIEQCEKLARELTAIEAEETARNFPNCPPAPVTVARVGRKFAHVNVGTSGAWMVEVATGEIYNIQGYGKPDYNKKRKADIGNVFTVDAREMHKRRYNYLR